MKIILVTLHSQNNNFGTVLQAYSLNKYIQNLGYSISTLDYRPFYSNGANTKKEKIKIFLTTLLFFPFYVKRNQKFNKLINSVSLTKRYKTYEEITQDLPEADIFLTGSDQIWNPKYLCGNDKTFYLDFTNKPKIAYSSSVGIRLNDSQILTLLNKLKDFRYIGVREKITEEQIKNNSNKIVKHVCDPVFLLSYDQYKEIEKCVKQLINQDFVLVYAMEKSDMIENAVSFYKSNTNYKIVSIGGFRKKVDCDYYFRAAGPQEFLWLFRNAKYIITSSFHGTAYSLIYKKQFICIKPKISNERLNSLLTLVNLKDRFVASINDLDKTFSNCIDYSVITPKLDSFIEESKAFLKSELEGCSHE